uniref:ABC transporter substrate-binding protein n=1 Tax=Panagrellus redivivus TaxID=6233 RepID=A0A7E4V0U0_PANRE
MELRSMTTYRILGLQLLCLALIMGLTVVKAQETFSNLEGDYPGLEAADVASAPYERHLRTVVRNAWPSQVGRAGRRMSWNMLIRPGMAGGFQKRVSEREINHLLKNTWLG